MLASILLSLLLAQSQGPEKLALHGATNVTRVDATVACAGATTPEAFAEIKKLGFSSVINLRREGEQGVDIPAARAAAEAVGLAYIHLPFDAAKPDPSVADAFLKVIVDPSNQPVYVHCATGGRAAAMWMIKRVVVDGWDIPRAREEAAAIGLKREALQQFALEYATTHRKQ